MSIEKVARQNVKTGYVWRVRWRDGAGPHSRVLGAKTDAEAFDAEIKRRKRLGGIVEIETGRETLSQFTTEQWWPKYAAVRLARATRVSYAGTFDRYILSELGGFALRSITPQTVATWQESLQSAGVGAPTIHRAMAVLSGIMQRAVAWERIPSNPVRAVGKPKTVRRSIGTAYSPLAVERMRDYLLSRDRHYDATLVAVLGYAGLRPGEALALTWRDVGKQAIAVSKSISFGDVKGTKTGGSRSVDLLAPLKKDLDEWRMAIGRPDDAALVFPRKDGKPWTDFDYRNWRKRTFKPAAAAAGFEGSRPYDLRHSFASLMFSEGRSIVELAEMVGNSPNVLLGTYLHVVKELQGGERVSADAQIRDAREKVQRGDIAPIAASA